MIPFSPPNAASLCSLQAKTFEKRARKLKDQKKEENSRKKVIFVVIGLVAAAIIIGLIVFGIVSQTGGGN